MSDTSHDHEIVSIYGYSEAQIDKLMTSAKASARANETDLSDRLEG